MSVEAPTADKRGIFHLTTIRFPSYDICQELGPLNATLGTWDMCKSATTKLNGQGNRYYYGKNILGTSTWVDIERTYDMTRSIGKRGSTGNLTSHMQVDKIDVDFGFMTNAGFSVYGSFLHYLITEGYDKEEISASRTLFWVGVEVQQINFLKSCDNPLFHRYLTIRRPLMGLPISC